MLLHHGPYELPIATVNLRRPRVRALARDLASWVLARWRWLRPRTIPTLVGLAGLVLFLGASSYLGDLARGEPGEPAQPMAVTLEILGPDGEPRVLEVRADMPVIRLSSTAER